MTWEENADQDEHQTGDAMHAYYGAAAGQGYGGTWHATCTSPCLMRGAATDHSHAVGQGGQHLSSHHFGESEGIHIRQNEHGQSYWQCLAACGYVGPTRASEEDANGDADEHRSQRPQHMAYVSVEEGAGEDS